MLTEQTVAFGDLPLPNRRAILAAKGQQEDFIVLIGLCVAGGAAVFGVPGKSLFANGYENCVFPNDRGGGAPDGSLARQITLSFSVQVIARFFAPGAEPFDMGPRHWGQLAKAAVVMARVIKQSLARCMALILLRTQMPL